MGGSATVVTAAAMALVAGYLVGRVRPWRRLCDWAEDQVRFTGAWVRGGRVRRADLSGRVQHADI